MASRLSRRHRRAARRVRQLRAETLEPRLLLSVNPFWVLLDQLDQQDSWQAMPPESLGIPIDPAAGQALSDGLESLADWGDALNSFDELARELPLIGESIGSVLDLGNLLQDRFVDSFKHRNNISGSLNVFIGGH